MEQERNMLDLAEYDYAKAMELDSTSQDYVVNHLDVLIALGKKAEAYRDLERLLVMGVKPGQLQNFYARLRKKK